MLDDVIKTVHITAVSKPISVQEFYVDYNNIYFN
jgi:hypothetical protein